MKVRFQADANLNPRVGLGLRRREPAIDYQRAQGAIPDGMPDHEVLRLAAALNRVLVSADLRTMPRHFSEFIAREDSPGIILVPSGLPLSGIIEGLFVIWDSIPAEDLRNQLWWIRA